MEQGAGVFPIRQSDVVPAAELRRQVASCSTTLPAVACRAFLGYGVSVKKSLGPQGLNS